MANTAEGRRTSPIDPLYAFLIAGTVPLFLGGLLSDLAYGASAEMQWSNFAAWLIVGAMVITGLALLCALVSLIRAGAWRGWRLLCFGLLLAAFAFGLVNSFVHARDAWGIMPAAPILSAIATAIVILAAGVGFWTLRAGDRT